MNKQIRIWGLGATDHFKWLRLKRKRKEKKRKKGRRKRKRRGSGSELRTTREKALSFFVQ